LNFWDASAVLPLVVRESSSPLLGRLAAKGRAHVVWWGTSVECDSAIGRLRREGRLTADEVAEIQESLDALLESWAVVEPSGVVKSAARRLLRLYPLRAGDALQLAAAVAAAEGQPEAVSFVSLDGRLRDAAGREAFRVLPEPKRARRRG
jgi:predicted nucleic acid-binding protein